MFHIKNTALLLNGVSGAVFSFLILWMAGAVHGTVSAPAATGRFSPSFPAHHTGNDSRHHDDQNCADDDRRHIFHDPCKHRNPPVLYALPDMLCPVTPGKEVSTNNRCKFIASFIVFIGFCLKKLQRLLSDNY